MKDLKKKHPPDYYRNHLLDKLYNLRQDDMSVRDYMAAFDVLIHHCDAREDHY